MKILCVIPARYASSRLPGKPLADIAGKPMIQHVYERACLAKSPDEVLVATDHPLVVAAVETFAGHVVMTSPNHPTGTDRLAEVLKKRPEVDLVINVQGDEPLLAPEIIDQLAAAFEQEPQLEMATMKTLLDAAELDNPNAVKVVTDKHDYALYFSRSALPYQRVKTGHPVYKHIGVYAYRRDFLLQYAAMEPTPLEQAESLEQLRALENGYRIKVLTTTAKFIGVDTPEDLAAVNKLLKNKK